MEMIILIRVGCYQSEMTSISQSHLEGYGHHEQTLNLVGVITVG